MKYKKGYKYQLVSPETFQLEVYPLIPIHTKFLSLYPNGTLIIREGYAWDGASGIALDTKSFMRGSLVHDALYQLLRLKLLPQYWRKQADKELIKICKEDGMWSIRRSWVYKALRLAGSYAADPKNKKKIYEV